jgi:hypothetical protein
VFEVVFFFLAFWLIFGEQQLYIPVEQEYLSYGTYIEKPFSFSSRLRRGVEVIGSLSSLTLLLARTKRVVEDRSDNAYMKESSWNDGYILC